MKDFSIYKLILVLQAILFNYPLFYFIIFLEINYINDIYPKLIYNKIREP